MYYTRPVRRPVQQLRGATLLAAVIFSGAAVSSQPAGDAVSAWQQAAQSSAIDPAIASRVERFLGDADVRVETRDAAGRTALQLIAITGGGPSVAQSLIDTAAQSADRLAAWLGALPFDRLTIVDVPAHANLAGVAYPRVAITSSPLWTTRREFAAERALTVAIARQYALALASGDSNDAWFAEGLASYLATRAIHEIFEGRYFLTLRYFGGHVPHSLRAILMSPNPLDPRPRVVDLPEVVEPRDAPWRLAHGDDLDRAHRVTIALHTLERFIGWPALQAALRAFFESDAGASRTLHDFVAVLSEQRGSDLTWFFEQALRAGAEFDYAVTDFISAASGDRWAVTAGVRRLGEATFDGTILPRSAGPAHSLPVIVRFADGSEVTEWIDGRDREWRFEYSAASPGRLASVDPNTILIGDADRANNTRVLDAPANPVGVRLAFNWLAWLQDAMLTCTALL